MMSSTKDFADPVYAYSIRLPVSWKPYSRASRGEPPQRLSLSTPNNNTFIVSVYRLPQTVTSLSEFETIGRDYVDPIVTAYRTSFDVTTFWGDKKENQSVPESMRFWQGTSGIDVYARPTMILSLHAIRYGSDLMVNVVYISGNDSTEEVAAVDAAMNSLSFASP
jgi:hypothetical protein